jgi:hypothetical protein
MSTEREHQTGPDKKTVSRWKLYPVLGAIILLLALAVSCDTNPRHVYEGNVIEMGGDGKPIELIQNPGAANPTYDELVTMLRADVTDTLDYISQGVEPYPAYVCSDFAEAVHNNAEAAGVRAAWVSIDFENSEVGHACNAFETLDKGLVFIDCTGRNAAADSGPDSGTDPPSSWDKVAYIEVGEEYGLIALGKATSPDYGFYETYRQQWLDYKSMLADYNEDVSSYNEEVQNNTYTSGTPELAFIRAWEEKLDNQKKLIDDWREKLGDSWFEPLGVVKNINIHW